MRGPRKTLADERHRSVGAATNGERRTRHAVVSTLTPATITAHLHATTGHGPHPGALLDNRRPDARALRTKVQPTLLVRGVGVVVTPPWRRHLSNRSSTQSISKQGVVVTDMPVKKTTRSAPPCRDQLKTMGRSSAGALSGRRSTQPRSRIAERRARNRRRALIRQDESPASTGIVTLLHGRQGLGNRP